jgi:D-beta-D-heptose 7-phosphate kinase/D-beta-D-heptose 1-phosphate adenosyltransferase
MNVVVLSGGFDPVHDGHIEMFKDARNKYDLVLVGLNSDDWLNRKKGRAFMPFDVRFTVLDSCKYIDEVFSFDDSDDTANMAIQYALDTYGLNSITFGNGGDRSGNFPEKNFCFQNDILIDDTLGGTTKLNSSSDFLAEWKFQPTDREWGLWKVLADYKTVKVKELVVAPNSHLSWQSHEKRNELWFIREGTATIYYSSDDSGKDVFVTKKTPNDTFLINKRKWHQLANETEESVSVIEIQYGDECVEHDILRAVRPTRGILPS